MLVCNICIIEPQFVIVIVIKAKVKANKKYATKLYVPVLQHKLNLLRP